MHFEIVESLNLPGDPAKPNEDAFAADGTGAVVLDGATMVSENLMPGKSDAAWIATFGARRLQSHWNDAASPRAALRHALVDAERSFAGLRRRPPAEPYELPCASMIFAMPHEDGFEALWYGDCLALVARPGAPCEVVGQPVERRAGESDAAQRFVEKTGLAPVEALKRPEYLKYFQDGRRTINGNGGAWLFSPHPHVSEHVAHARIAAPPGTLVLLASDGFFALALYGLLALDGLVAAAAGETLAALGARLRAFEDSDPEGHAFPRFKKSDDATAVLLRLT
jgi:hypothetical protein